MAAKSSGYLLIHLALLIAQSYCLKLGGKEYSFTVSIENGVHTMVMYDSLTNVWAGEAKYNETYLETGWDMFDVATNPSEEDIKQAMIAGFNEGYLTQKAIYDHYYNTVHRQCEGKAEICKKINNFLEENGRWMKKMLNEKAESDPYWKQVQLFFSQVAGIYLGYKQAAPADQDIAWEDMLWMNFEWDRPDLESTFKNETNRGLRGVDHCSALIKILPDKSDILVSHNTWTGYQTMRRIMKRYLLPYRGVRSASMSFSGYPGAIVSGDDFYILGSGLVAQETTNSQNNAELWSRVKPVGQLMEVIRVTVANRLSDGGQSWTKIFSEYNSGTYNNQWMIVDMTNFSPGSVKPGLLWVAEQMPGVVRREDMTETLLRQGYWSSFNIPYFPDIYNMSGHPELAKKYGDFFTHDKNPRALIFKRDQEKVLDVRSMMHLMRSNDFKHDPLSRCECNPPFSAENAIASRNDLNLVNGTYPFHALSHRSSGTTDAKVTNWRMSRDLAMAAVSGPTTGAHLPPFRWSASGFDLPHRGHPDLFNFDPIMVRWPDHRQGSR